MGQLESADHLPHLAGRTPLGWAAFRCLAGGSGHRQHHCQAGRWHRRHGGERGAGLRPGSPGPGPHPGAGGSHHARHAAHADPGAQLPGPGRAGGDLHPAAGCLWQAQPAGCRIVGGGGLPRPLHQCPAGPPAAGDRWPHPRGDRCGAAPGESLQRPPGGGDYGRAGAARCRGALRARRWRLAAAHLAALHDCRQLRRIQALHPGGGGRGLPGGGVFRRCGRLPAQPGGGWKNRQRQPAAAAEPRAHREGDRSGAPGRPGLAHGYFQVFGRGIGGGAAGGGAPAAAAL